MPKRDSCAEMLMAIAASCLCQEDWRQGLKSFVGVVLASNIALDKRGVNGKCWRCELSWPAPDVWQKTEGEAPSNAFSLSGLD